MVKQYQTNLLHADWKCYATVCHHLPWALLREISEELKIQPSDLQHVTFLREYIFPSMKYHVFMASSKTPQSETHLSIKNSSGHQSTTFQTTFSLQIQQFYMIFFQNSSISKIWWPKIILPKHARMNCYSRDSHN